MRPFRFRTEANAKGQRPAAPFSDFGRFQWADQVDANDYSMDQVGIQHDSNSGIIQRETWPAGAKRRRQRRQRRRRKEKASEAVEMAGRVGSNLMEMSCLSEFPLGRIRRAASEAALPSAPPVH